MFISAFKKLTFWLLLSLTLSCEVVEMDPLVIESASPSASLLADFADLKISFVFNRSVHINSVESNFSLSDNGVNLRGSFTWSGDNTSMTFLPHDELLPEKRYKIVLKTGAEDVYGNSLKEAYIRYIYTVDDQIRPEIVTFTPQGAVTDAFTPVIMEFSEGINPEEVFNSFSVNPSLEGSWTWNPEMTVYTYTPHSEYKWNEPYTFKITTQLSDPYGNTLNEEKVFRALREGIKEPVELLSLTAQSSGGVMLMDDPQDSVITYNRTLPVNETFQIEFNRAVDVTSIKSWLSFSPAVSYDIEEEESLFSSTVTLLLKNPMDYEAVYTLTVKKGIKDEYDNELAEDLLYYLKFDSQVSTPPKLDTSEVWFYDPVLNSLKKILPFETFEIDGNTEGVEYYTYMDLHLKVADKTSVLADENRLLNSFLENFSLSPTNACADILILGASVNPPTGNTDTNYNDVLSPMITTGADSFVIRVYFTYTSSPSGGTINMTLDKGFSDGINTLGENVSVLYNKG